MQLAGTHRARLRMGSNETVDQALMKPHRLIRRVQRDGMLLHTWGTEVVAPAADRQHQCVKAKGACRGDLATLIVEASREVDLLLLAVQIDHLADAIAEMMAMRLRQIIDGMVTDIHAAGRYLMQKRFPDMRPRALDQRHLGFPVAAKPVAQLGHKLQPCRTATNNHNLMERRLRRGQ